MKRRPPPSPLLPPPPAPPDAAAINATLERDLDLARTDSNLQAIKRAVGPIHFRMIEAILSFASNQDAWLNDRDLSSAADKVTGRLSQTFPWLSPRAVFKIVSQTSFGWR